MKNKIARVATQIVVFGAIGVVLVAANKQLETLHEQYHVRMDNKHR